MKQITSVHNEEIKKVLKLYKANKRKKEGVFVVEGQREIQLAIDAGYRLETFFYCSKFHSKQEYLFDYLSERTIEVIASVFSKISYRENPDGCLALFHYQEMKLDQIKLSNKPLVIILESVEKPGNLGAILRTAFAAKVDAIIINDPKTDILNPNVIKASMGHVFTNQVVVADRKETISWLLKNNIKAFASSTKAKKVYSDINFKPGSAIVLGTEYEGLSAAWQKEAYNLMYIPMQAGIDSLNVSVSAAIIIYEAKRQRSFDI